MRKVVVGLMVCLTFLASAPAPAAVVTPGQPVLITQSYAYASFGGGDFVFSTSVAASGCANGWYVKTTDPGYSAIVATVMTAQAAGLQVSVYGDNSDVWPGSATGQYCRLQTVGLSS